jgi:hypothetical protein
MLDGGPAHADEKARRDVILASCHPTHHGEQDAAANIAVLRGAAMEATMSTLPDWVEKLRETLDPLLSLKTWAKVRGRCIASVYNEIHRHPEIALKDGGSTKIIRDRALPLLAALPAWTPECERADGDDKPYARSRPRPGPVNCIADAAKPTPTSAPVVSQPRREPLQRASAAPPDASPKRARAAPSRPATAPAQPRRPRATAPSAAPASATSALAK